jgi:hypothetical protein
VHRPAVDQKIAVSILLYLSLYRAKGYKILKTDKEHTEDQDCDDFAG